MKLTWEEFLITVLALWKQRDISAEVLVSTLKDERYSSGERLHRIALALVEGAGK